MGLYKIVNFDSCYLTSRQCVAKDFAGKAHTVKLYHSIFPFSHSKRGFIPQPLKKLETPSPVHPHLPGSGGN